MTIYGKGCISNYRNCSLCYVCYSVLYRMLTEEELNRLCEYITEYSLGDTPREVSPVSGDSALKSIDLMHFGWNIG